MECRGCGASQWQPFVDLGSSPPSNAFLSAADLALAEKYYPLNAQVCARCRLVQVGVFESPEQIFTDYAYFSSYSVSWLAHSRAYVEMIVPHLGLNERSSVVEIASNDGYLLQYFIERGIPAIGIEPAQNVAAVARERGVPTESFFLGRVSANAFVNQHAQADLVLANNVLAHVPDIADFIAGVAALLKATGVATFEFPHLARLIEDVQFDTIYHEHFSYLSLLAVEPIFERHGLRAFDVAELPTHGGSLRLFVAPALAGRTASSELARVRASELQMGLDDDAIYAQFAPRVHGVKREFLRFLIEAADTGKGVAAYGAAAKGNTLLNYCGVRPDQLAMVADRNPHKQDRWMPGSRIPIVSPETLMEARPDYVIILPWNIKDEVMEQMAPIRDYGGRFVVAVPSLAII